MTNQSEIDVDLGRLQQLATFVLKCEEIEAGDDVSVALVDPDKMQELNRRYRQIDRPTDVLSFDLSDDGKLSGEVVISPQVAAENGAIDATSGPDEIDSLLIHGLLHLLGFTHDYDEDAEVMFDRHEMIRREFSANKGSS